MEVRDEDQIHTPCWRSRFRIIQGDSDHLFSISTGPSGDQGIIATAKVLLRMYKTHCSQDYEKNWIKSHETDSLQV